MIVVEDAVHRIVSSPASFPFLPTNRFGSERGMNFQSFLQALFHFPLKGGHFFA